MLKTAICPTAPPPTASHDEEVSHLTRFRGISVPGGQQKETPGTLLQRNRGRWTAGKDTWNAFAGIPCQVDGRKSYLEHFRRNSVPGGRQEETPGTLSQENRGRGTAEKRHMERSRGNAVPGGRRRRDTWYTFAGIPCQVEGGERHLER